jgi:hypothetical protein
VNKTYRVDSLKWRVSNTALRIHVITQYVNMVCLILIILWQYPPTTFGYMLGLSIYSINVETWHMCLAALNCNVTNAKRLNINIWNATTVAVETMWNVVLRGLVCPSCIWKDRVPSTFAPQSCTKTELRSKQLVHTVFLKKPECSSWRFFKSYFFASLFLAST